MLSKEWSSQQCISPHLTLGDQHYKIPKIAPIATISSMIVKQRKKLFFQIDHFLLFMVKSNKEREIAKTTKDFVRVPLT
jgi:hypothetical protein